MLRVLARLGAPPERVTHEPEKLVFQSLRTQIHPVANEFYIGQVHIYTFLLWPTARHQTVEVVLANSTAMDAVFALLPLPLSCPASTLWNPKPAQPQRGNRYVPGPFVALVHVALRLDSHLSGPFEGLGGGGGAVPSSRSRGLGKLTRSGVLFPRSNNSQNTVLGCTR